MIEIIKHYKTLLPCDQFVITGSFAMSLYGLLDKNKVGDLDLILVNPTDEAKNILERLQKDQPAKTKPNSGGNVSYIFMHEKTKIDVFIVSAPVLDNGLSFNDCMVNPIDNIVKAKKKYNRMKDWIQLRNYSRRLFEPDEFQKFLDSLDKVEDLPF